VYFVQLSLFSVADFGSAECAVSFDARGHDRTLIVGPSNSHRCGGETSPWTLSVDNGQRVNVTLVQFGADDDRGVDGDSTVESAAHDEQHRYHAGADDHTALQPVTAVPGRGSGILQGRVSNPSERGTAAPPPIILTHVTGTKQFFGHRRNSWRQAVVRHLELCQIPY